MSIDPETPPEVQEQLDLHKKFMSADFDETNTGTVIEEGSEVESFEELTKVIKEKPKKPRRTFKVTLSHHLYTVSFDVEDISEADYQVALKIPKTDFRFEPLPNSKFTMKVRGSTYNLLYVGGLFDFPSDSTWALTFLIEDPKTADDE